MKRIFALGTAAVMIAATLASCGAASSTTASSSTAAPAGPSGTFTASADGFGGPVSVTLTLTDGKITASEVVGDSETESIGGAALDTLAQQLIDANSAEIDGVSGATVTSNAVKSAAAAALAAANGEASTISYKAGTYTESAMGRNASLTVEVTFSENSIDAVNITDHAETMTVAGVALERIPAQIVEHQTTKIDAVTGATVTCNAIKTAVNAAIEKAGVSPASLPEAYATAGEAIEQTADIIVVGGGGAGMSAATAALQNGASVILIEKTAMLGGNTVVCGGVLNAADTEWASQFNVQTGEVDSLNLFLNMDPETLPEEYRADLLTLKEQIKEYLAGDTSVHFDSVEYYTIQTYYYGLRQSLDGDTVYGDYSLVSTMTENAMDTVAWLEGLGMVWQEDVTQAVGGMWRRGHNPSMSKGSEYVSVLEKAITGQGGIVMYETTGESLIQNESGRVVGVNAVKADGTPVTLYANKGVVLATGGYGNNLELVQSTDNYWGNIPDDIGCTNVSGTTGEGMLMATEIGAGTTGTEYTQLMAVADPDSGDLFTGLLPKSTANYIFVNSEGNRFVNECEARDVLAAAAIENGGTFYMIADINIAEDARWLSNWEEEVERGNTIMADTLEELADKMGYNEEQKANFLKAMENYNSYVDSGSDPECNKTAFDMKVETAPFFASARKPAIHHTMGGLTINTAANVLDTNGEIIDGLYAAGEVTGGIHAGNRIGGNAVTDAITFGRIAGESAAKAD